MTSPRRAAGAALVAAVALTGGVWTACSACGGGATGRLKAAPAESPVVPASRTLLPSEAGATAQRDVAMWTTARDGASEDLASLATHEGAAGLVEAAADPELRSTALRAMAFAQGWSHLPYLAGVATGDDDGDAILALTSAFELSARARKAEDVEDVDELREGCEKLGALAHNVKKTKETRILAFRALRMTPCPKPASPDALDAR